MSYYLRGRQIESADDEQMKILEVDESPTFTGVGGTCQWPFPWVLWRGRGWFQGAMAIASLSVKCLEKVIPGYRKFEESFQEDYFGAFIFRLWRFGAWQDIIVDDNLPFLDSQVAYCEPVGSHHEYWAPLLEKAYAKCNRTYESIENGNILDALTDLTGAICEYFTPDVNPPHNLFRLLHMSCFHRSLIVCWRSEKRLTPIGFIVYQPSQQTSIWNDAEDTHRFLHIVTAATKFQTTDGRMLEMVRLKCPYPAEPKWCGRFSDSDKTMWDTVNGDFMERYKPLQNKEQDEYWMTVEDFRCNFGSMIICSSSEPYVPEGLNLTRKYSRTEKHFVLQSQQVTHLKSSAFKLRSWSLTEQYSPSECGDDVLKRDLLDTPHIFKDRQEESPDSGGSFRSVFSPSNNKIFQFELGCSQKSPDFIEPQPHHHRSLTSSPISGIQRKLAYQPPGRSPLVSENSGEEPKPDPGKERRQSRPLIRGKSANLPRDTLSESISNLGESSWVSSYKDLLAPFGIKRKCNNEVTDSSSDFVKMGDFQKTQKAKSFDGCTLPTSRDSSSQGESNQTTSVRSKSVSLYQSYYREQEKLKEKSQVTAKSSTKTHSGVGASPESKEAEKGINVSRKTSCGQNETEQTRRPSIQFFRQATIEGDTEEPIASTKGEPEKPMGKKMSEEKKGKTLFKSCLSTDEDDDDDDVDDVRDDSCKNLSHDTQMTGIQEREIRKDGEESSKPELTVDNSSQARKISSESEKGVRVTISPTKTNLQSSQSSESNSDFIALVNKVKKVRLRSAPDRTHSESTSGGFTQPQQQASMTPPTRKYGRHERLNLFCHSNRESSQSVSDLTSRIDACAATTSAATLLPMTDEHRNISLGTVSSLSESNFLASKVDHFCPTGRWSQLVNYHGNWTKRNNSFDMDQNPRILLTVHKLDAWKSDLDTVFSGRSHVIISLLQDYRHGSSTANNLIQPIGFCIYKTKYPEKDEKRLLSKLTFVSKEMSNGGSREVIKRTNLEQGNYFIVPFCSNKEHTGEFIVRVLAEKNVKEEKSDCKLS